MENYIRITPDTIIYRVFKIRRLLDIFKTNKLTLVKPKKWDDPFDNFMMRCVAVNSDTGTEFDLSGVFEIFYGQCWTLNPETDSMWRIYSPKKDGVKVKSVAHKIFSVIYDTSDKFANLSCHIGKVEYKKIDEIVKTLQSEKFFKDFINGKITAENLVLIKREEFKHEHEVRILYASTTKYKPSRKTAKFTVNPNDLFDQIVLDPRMKLTDVEKYTNSLRALGFTKEITQSEIYKAPETIYIKT